MKKSQLIAEAIWIKYERHLGNPGHANQDKDSFIQTVTSIVDAIIPPGAQNFPGQAPQSVQNSIPIKLQIAAVCLKNELFGGGNDQGFLGVGENELIVFVHGKKSQWKAHHLDSFHGFPVKWRYEIGPAVAS